MLSLLVLFLLLLPTVHHAFSASSTPPIHIAVTREPGKNEKLIQQLLASTRSTSDDSIATSTELHELSCIEHAVGEDYDRFESTLYDADDDPWDYVIVTSPEAAKILCQVWDDDASLQSKVAVVGAATAKVLQDHGIAVDFVPSRATAVDLAKELPFCQKVLYAASAKAPETLQKGLAKRGIHTERLNTYDTVTSSWNETQRNIAETCCDIVCLASPSAVHGWTANTDARPMAICIGKTTADACKGIFDDVRYPNNPGMEAWVQLIAEAVREQQQQQQQVDTTTSIS